MAEKETKVLCANVECEHNKELRCQKLVCENILNLTEKQDIPLLLYEKLVDLIKEFGKEHKETSTATVIGVLESIKYETMVGCLNYSDGKMDNVKVSKSGLYV